MPWTVEDVDKHKKGLTDKQKEQWVAVANSALERCEEKGGSDCEASAIKQANSVVGKAEEAFEAWFDTLDEEIRELVEDHTHGLKSALTKERKARKDAEARLKEQPIEEAEIVGDFIPLVEKAVAEDGTIPVKLIQPGWGTSGYYGPELLERDGPKIFTAGTQMFWDHPTETEERERPERSIRDLAGELTEDAVWNPKGPYGPGLYARGSVFGPFQDAVDELAPHIGLSINARGRAKEGETEGRKGPIIQEITAARSVDFVTVPGAGGQIVELFEAARGKPPRKEKPQEGNMPNDTELQEARDQVKATEEKMGELETENARLREVVLLGKAKGFVSGKLAEMEIPELTKARMTESLSRKPPVKDGELDEDAYEKAIEEAVKAEIAYLAEITGSGRIQGMGGSEPAEGDAEGLKKLEESWEQRYLDEGYDAETAKRMAGISVRGR